MNGLYICISKKCSSKFIIFISLIIFSSNISKLSKLYGNSSEIIEVQGVQGNPDIKGLDGPKYSYNNNQSPYSICSPFIIQENNVSGVLFNHII